MRRTSWYAAVLLAASVGTAGAQGTDEDLAFMETCRPERNCSCDSVDDWFACVVDASRLSQRGALDAEAFVASVVPEADRHLARDCAPQAGILHRLCDATRQLREIALSAAPGAAFAAADIHGEPELDAPNDAWRAFLEGATPEPVPSPGPLPSPSPGPVGGPGPFPSPLPSPSPFPLPVAVPGISTAEAQELFEDMGLGPQGGPTPQGGARVPAGDAQRRAGSPQTASAITAAAATRMCQTVSTSGGDPAWIQCVPPLCDCPDGPKVHVTIGGSPMEISPKMVCETVGQGLGDLLEKVAHVPSASAQMLSLLGMAAQVLDAIASNAGPILCGYARNQVYLSEDCINDYSKTECEGARLALQCLGCGDNGARECSARCLCFWQALSNYNENRRRREGPLCRSLGIGCPDDRGYFYRLGVSCLNPPPGGLRGGGYR